MAFVRYVPPRYQSDTSNSTTTKKPPLEGQLHLKTALSYVQDAIVKLQEVEVELLLSLTDSEQSTLESDVPFDKPYHSVKKASGKRKSQAK